MFVSRPHRVGHILAANNTTHLIANHTPETTDRDRKRSDYCWFNSFFEPPAVAVIAAGGVPRVHTVWRQHNGFPHALLCRFQGLPGSPVLINSPLKPGRQADRRVAAGRARVPVHERNGFSCPGPPAGGEVSICETFNAGGKRL